MDGKRGICWVGGRIREFLSDKVVMEVHIGKGYASPNSYNPSGWNGIMSYYSTPFRSRALG